MKIKICIVSFLFIIILVIFSCDSNTEKPAPTTYIASAVPVKGMVTMIDLGADKCKPCKMMKPILERVTKQYHGEAAIVFIDVWKDTTQAKRFKIRSIPTQIFFDAKGAEVYRHIGFMSEKDIKGQLHKMGVKPA